TRHASNNCHIFRTRAAILGANVPAPQSRDRLSACQQKLPVFRSLRLAAYVGVAATEPNSRHRRPVEHRAGTAGHTIKRLRFVRVWPEAATTERRTECRVVDGDARLQPGVPIAAEHHLFMAIEGLASEDAHLSAPAAHGTFEVYALHRNGDGRSFRRAFGSRHSARARSRKSSRS